MFPLSSVLFPGAELPLHIFESRYRDLTAYCMAGDGEFGVVLIARGSEVGGGDERFGVGTVAHIEQAARFDDGRWALVTVGRRRIAVAEWLPDAPYPVAAVDDLPDGPESADDAQFVAAASAVRRVRTLLSEMGRAAPVMEDLGADTGGTDEERVWRLCAMAPLTALDGQRLLATVGVGPRLELLTELCTALAGDLTLLLGGDPGPRR
jgi:Lon protease-like protein